MAIYNSLNERLNTTHDTNGISLNYAYSIDKDKVYTSTIENEIVVMSYNIELFSTRNNSSTNQNSLVFKKQRIHLFRLKH